MIMNISKLPIKNLPESERPYENVRSSASKLYLMLNFWLSSLKPEQKI